MGPKLLVRCGIWGGDDWIVIRVKFCRPGGWSTVDGSVTCAGCVIGELAGGLLA